MTTSVLELSGINSALHLGKVPVSFSAQRGDRLLRLRLTVRILRSEFGSRAVNAEAGADREHRDDAPPCCVTHAVASI